MPTYAKSQSSIEQNNNNQSSGSSSSQPIQSSGENSLSSSASANGDDITRSTMACSNSDYDHIRNTTLLFFLDRLMLASKDGKEAHTLHDLSCLFGTKDFTKEMRQIVGASRNGLKKFLQSYPSLFTIDGDKVFLTQLNKQDSTNPSGRDYNKEAVEYFTQKLLQFGASLVPIKNLFGYRSQASQEVRHVSGKSAKEFKQFLSLHQDVFEILADEEHVVLKSALQELESRGEGLPATLQQVAPNEESVMDPYLNKQFAHSIEDCMKRMTELDNFVNENGENNKKDEDEKEGKDEDEKEGKDEERGRIKLTKVTLEHLHEKIIQDCNNQLFLKMVKTIEDLKVFLRMHPKIFKRFKCDQDQREYVSLLTEEERRQKEIQAYPSLQIHHQNQNQSQNQHQRHSSLKRCDTNESNLSENSLSGPQSFQPMSIMLDPPANKSAKRSDDTNDNHARATTPSNRSSSHNDSLNGRSSSLRATAPPFIPSTQFQQQQQSSKSLQIVNQHHHNQTCNSRQDTSLSINKVSAPQPIKRSLSNLNPSTPNHHHNLQPKQTSRDQQPAVVPNQRHVIDPRQALRSYLIKASAVNTANGLYSPSKLSNGANFQQSQSQSQSQPQLQQRPLSRQKSNDASSTDDLRARTINIVREASNIVTRIMNSAEAVAFDCKGYNLGFDGEITLIQFAFLPKSTLPVGNSHPTLHLDNNNVENQRQPDGKQRPEVCIFDIITNPELAYCLKPLLESEQIVKIVHDVRNKSNALYVQFGIMLNHVFDTQVANLVIQQQETGKPAYKSRYISISKLCEIYGDESLKTYRFLIKSKTRHSGSSNNSNSNQNLTSSNKIKDANYWCTRPLTDAMVYESTMDVYCLVGGIYQNLKPKLKPEYKPLFEQLNLEGVLARIKPDEIRSVKKERKMDLEVIDLKRKLYSDTTSPIVLSNREIRLLRHIDLTEEVRHKIQQCKKVAKKLERLDMKAAQNSQMLLSISSQVSSDGGHNSSILEPMNEVQTDRSCSLSSQNIHFGDEKIMPTLANDNNQDSDCQTYKQAINGEEQQMGDNLGEETELMANLMDSSMFDELKDKMIESSSLLESLEDDDDDVHVGLNENSHQFEHSGNHDNCRCLCHKGLVEGDKTSISSPTNISTSRLVPKPDKEIAIAVETKAAVDMAIQCDLLS